jgi:hypothetical protein
LAEGQCDAGAKIKLHIHSKMGNLDTSLFRHAKLGGNQISVQFILTESQSDAGAKTKSHLVLHNRKNCLAAKSVRIVADLGIDVQIVNVSQKGASTILPARP